MNILVTGGAGFIGSHIVEHFHRDHRVTVLDSLRSGYRKNVDPFDVDFVEGSVTDEGLVDKVTEGVDYVFHLAALVSVPESMEKPGETVRINTIGILNVLEAARRHGVKKVVLSSSAAIYGDNPKVPKIEDMLPEPKSPYAVTKLDGEYYLKMFHQEYGLETVSLRYFNVFGPRQDPKSQYAAAIPIFMARALRNEDLTIFGDGEQTRDFIFVKDVVKANVLATTPGVTGLYNVARGEKITINDLARRIIEMTGSSSKIVYTSERPGDVKHSLADTARIRSLGFVPSASREEGLSETVAYFADLFKKQSLTQAG
jgi:UDP-glucose 4-epimerase